MIRRTVFAGWVGIVWTAVNGIDHRLGMTALNNLLQILTIQMNFKSYRIQIVHRAVIIRANLVTT